LYLQGLVDARERRYGIRAIRTLVNALLAARPRLVRADHDRAGQTPSRAK
jgi:hypothetical protein